MSIAVPLEDLPSVLERLPWALLVTVTSRSTSHVVSVPTVVRDAALFAACGDGTKASVGDRPHVTMVFPAADGREMSLIVDGVAAVVDDGVVVTPTNAVWHRPAIR